MVALVAALSYGLGAPSRASAADLVGWGTFLAVGGVYYGGVTLAQLGTDHAPTDDPYTTWGAVLGLQAGIATTYTTEQDVVVQWEADCFQGTNYRSAPVRITVPPREPQDPIKTTTSAFGTVAVPTDCAGVPGVNYTGWVQGVMYDLAGDTISVTQQLIKVVPAEALPGPPLPTVPGGLIQVWRVVGPDEAAQIQQSGSFPSYASGGGYFYPSLTMAERAQLLLQERGPQTLRIASGVIDARDLIQADGVMEVADVVAGFWIKDALIGAITTAVLVG